MPVAGGQQRGFGIAQTHGILRRPEHQIALASDGLGWHSLYVSRQGEQPYEAAFDAVADHLIVLHLDGPVPVECRLGRGLQARRVAPGGLFMLPGGMGFWVRLGQNLQSLHLYIRDAVLREVAAELHPGDPAHAGFAPSLGETDKVIDDLARAAHHVLASADPSSALVADHIARALAARLLCRSAPHAAAAPGTLNAGQLARVQDYVQAHLAHPIGLADLAATLGISATRFARAFRRSTGMPPYRQVLLARIARAQQLLGDSSRPIAEIALACGFAHQEHLTRLFHRETGTTPAAWRQRARL